MDMLDTVYVGHTICSVHGHNIFGMVVSDEIEIAEFSLDGIFRSKQVCNLHIDSSILILSNEIYFGFLQLPHMGFDKEGAKMLFNHLSLRTGKKSTIITTNLPFTRWEEVLKDKVLCSALVDRLCHKSYQVNMTGTSYRIKETKKYISNK